MKKYILVCGGAGYIGSYVIRKILDSGYQAVVVDDLSTGHLESIPEGVEFVKASIGDRKVMDAVFNSHNFQAVVHLCANAYVGESIDNPRKYYSNNVGNGLVLFEAMLDHGVKNIVFSSSCTVYGNPERIPIDEKNKIAPISPYGHTKAMLEQIMADFSYSYGLRYCALRYFNAAGSMSSGEIGEDHRPETHLIPLVLRQSLQIKFPQIYNNKAPFVLFGDDYNTPDGTCIRDYIHVEDIARAHCLAIEYLNKGGESIALNLANEQGFSVLQVLKICEEITGEKIVYTIGPRRLGDSDKLIGDASKAKDVLQWEPEFSDIRHIIRSAWKWVENHPYGYV